MTGRAWEHYTRGEDLAVVAMRFLGDATTREIGAAIGRSQNSVSERMTKLGVRMTGGREWAWRFLTNGHRVALSTDSGISQHGKGEA